MLSETGTASDFNYQAMFISSLAEVVPSMHGVATCIAAFFLSCVAVYRRPPAHLMTHLGMTPLVPSYPSYDPPIV